MNHDLYLQVEGMLGGRCVEREETYEITSAAQGDTASNTEADRSQYAYEACHSKSFGGRETRQTILMDGG